MWCFLAYALVFILHQVVIAAIRRVPKSTWNAKERSCAMLLPLSPSDVCAILVPQLLRKATLGILCIGCCVAIALQNILSLQVMDVPTIFFVRSRKGSF